MLDIAIYTITKINLYSITLVIILVLFLLSQLNRQFKGTVKKPLSYLAIIWIVFVGYKTFTGNDLYTVMGHYMMKREDTGVRKVMIDGREVIYDESTGEILKKKND